jgi:hypothetical protein
MPNIQIHMLKKNCNVFEPYDFYGFENYYYTSMSHQTSFDWHIITAIIVEISTYLHFGCNNILDMDLLVQAPSFR